MNYAKEIKIREEANGLLLNKLTWIKKEIKDGVDVELNKLRIGPILFSVFANNKLINEYRKMLAPK